MLYKTMYYEEKLNTFIINNKIPNILFYGENGSGKKTILNNFIDKIYNDLDDDSDKSNYIMYVNCAQGKGIKFIRDELNFFAKTNLNYNKNIKFKSIILMNAEKLTCDAQSALRRCIELFSLNTRFFIVIEDKTKLLKPILSRFCEIYISRPLIKGNVMNYYNLKDYELKKKISNTKNVYINKCLRDALDVKEDIDDINKNKEEDVDLIEICELFYNNGISGLNIIKYIENNMKEGIDKYTLLIHLEKIKYEYRNEKLLMYHILNLYLATHNEKENKENIIKNLEKVMC